MMLATMPTPFWGHGPSRRHYHEALVGDSDPASRAR
jgi:hypothetical protein